MSASRKDYREIAALLAELRPDEPGAARELWEQIARRLASVLANGNPRFSGRASSMRRV